MLYLEQKCNKNWNLSIITVGFKYATHHMYDWLYVRFSFSWLVHIFLSRYANEVNGFLYSLLLLCSIFHLIPDDPVMFHICLVLWAVFTTCPTVILSQWLKHLKTLTWRWICHSSMETQYNFRIFDTCAHTETHTQRHAHRHTPKYTNHCDNRDNGNYR